MKQFNLEEYLKNPSRKIVTKLGRNVRIICTDRADPIYPIVALIESKWGESTTLHTKDGKYSLNDASDYDLFFASEKHEGWINIFKCINGESCVGDARIFKLKEDAEKVGKNRDDYITTIKIEWEE